ncbi:hypothetical protein D3C72_1637530 [compost metagenome]
MHFLEINNRPRNSKTLFSISKLLSGFAFGTNKETIIVSKFASFCSISKIELLSPIAIVNSAEKRAGDRFLKKVLSVFL